MKDLSLKLESQRPKIRAVSIGHNGTLKNWDLTQDLIIDLSPLS